MNERTSRPNVNGKHRRGLSALRRGGAKDYPVFQLTVPSPIARALIAEGAEGMLFKAELTEDGILYRPIVDSPEEPEIPVPAWVVEMKR